jgi:hypothetical protein
MNWRTKLLLGVIAALILTVFFIRPIPQSEAYHDFADQRTLLRIPNCLNVISNAFFLIVGALGLAFLLGKNEQRQAKFIDSRERWPWFTFFAAATLTAFGSSYYHFDPNDRTLVWDRLPMAIGFMALLAAVIAERVNVKTGVRSLVPLAIVGVGSVLWWNVTQLDGRGDLRAYALVQFGSLVVLVLLVALYPPRYTRGADLVVSLLIYGIAKVFEAADRPIYALGHAVSGHTLKHCAAAVSAWWILRMLKKRRPIPAGSDSPIAIPTNS